MALKTVIITGGNSGLGFECAKSIARENAGWHIVLACRNLEKGMGAVEAITADTSNKNVSMLTLDLASLESVRNFVKEFQAANLPPLQGLICNAGLSDNKETKYTKDGFELIFGVNHLGHFLLTNLLLQQMVEPARIIVVSSNTHNPEAYGGRMASAIFSSAEELAHPDGSQKISGMQRYTTSKLCNLLFAYELDRILQKQGKKITVNSFCPGFTPGTNLGGNGNSVAMKMTVSGFGKAIFKMLGIKTSTPEKSGQAMGRLLLDSNLENTSGKYFQILEETPSSEDSYNQQKAKELWKDSIELTNYLE